MLSIANRYVNSSCNVLLIVSDKYWLKRSGIKIDERMRLVFISDLIKEAEYDLIKQAHSLRTIEKYLKDIELKLPRNCEYGLRDVFLSDRRLCRTKVSQYTQGLRIKVTSNFESMLLHRTLVMLDNYGEHVKRVYVTFACNLYTDLLFYLKALSEGSVFVNIRSARLKNYVFVSNDINDPDAQLLDALRYDGANYDTPTVRDIFDSLSGGESRYEGTDLALAHPKPGISRVKRLYRRLRITPEIFTIRDRHTGHAFLLSLLGRCMNLPRRMSGRLFFSKKSIIKRELPYYFFPLHAEPEVSLDVYGSPVYCQVDLIRKLCRLLPIGYELVVKEHPVMLGRRPLGFYREIANISSSVVLLPPDSNISTLVRTSKCVFSITGSVGWLALANGVPLVVLGRSIFAALENSRLVLTARVETLSVKAIQNFILHFRRDDDRVKQLLYAVTETGVRVNLYGDLIGRKFGSESHLDPGDIDSQIELIHRKMVASGA